MADLWLLVPSRGRPASVERLVRACALTCTADTRLHFAFDDDDPALFGTDLDKICGGHLYEVGHRDGLVGWTNTLARAHLTAGDAPVLGSIGDDMLPHTHGWDRLLLDAIPGGCGIAYPNDLRRADIPEMFIISASIVEALGWMMQPSLGHWYPDNVLADIGNAAKCMAYCDDVIVEHLHPNVRPDVTRPDGTYFDAAKHFDSDAAAYARWRLRGMPGDVAAVRRVRAAQVPAV